MKERTTSSATSASSNALANLAQRCGNIGFRKRATACQSIQNGSKTVLEVFKHRLFLDTFRAGLDMPGNVVLFLDENKTQAKKSTRGRIALSGVDLRDLKVPVGGSVVWLVADWAR
ncbi:hypothetical protein ACOJBO_23025 [Rhizobium beringeri]